MGAPRTIQDVAERHLCTGCGACAFVAPEALEMVDDLDAGRRPHLRAGHSAEETAEALAVCPGPGLEHRDPWPAEVLTPLGRDWGPVLELWEGHAADAEVRHLGSSGGVATALAIFALEEEGWSGILHIGPRADAPYLNETRLSSTRPELIAATGSRYAPASPCDGLGLVRDADGPCLMIGKPCDVAAAGLAAKRDPALAAKLGLTIGIFCAGTPSTRATLELARELGMSEPERDLGAVRYRGMGWPGRFRLWGRDGEPLAGEPPTYMQSWGKLQASRQWRCYVCADHTGEFADIAVGDPWYGGIPDDAPGRSLVLARTARGREFLARARAAGAVTLAPVAPDILPASQPNLLNTRGAIWARIWVCRLLGAAAPRYPGMRLFHLWRTQLSWRERWSSLVGTARRVFRKRLRARRAVVPYQAPTRRTDELD